MLYKKIFTLFTRKQLGGIEEKKMTHIEKKSKIADVNPAISTIILNVNGLNYPIQM